MKRLVWIPIACLVIGAATVGGWRLWQSWRLYSTLAKLSQVEGQDEPLRPDKRHLVAVRKLRFTWDTLVESGGPIVDPDQFAFRMAPDIAPPPVRKPKPLITALHVDLRALAPLTNVGCVRDRRKTKGPDRATAQPRHTTP